MKIVKNKETNKTILINNKKRKVYENMLTQTINELFDVGAGGDVSKLDWSEKSNEYYKFPIYSNYILNEGIYGYSNKYKLKGEYITITARGTIGKVFYRKGCFSPIGRLIYIKDKTESLNLKFFSFLLDRMEIIGEGGVINSLTAPMIKKHMLQYPKKSQQDKIAIILSDQETHINKIKSLIEKLELRNQEMAERLLSGKLRVQLDGNGKIEFYKNPDDNWKEELVNGYLHKEKMRIPKDWEIKKASSLVKLQKGCSVKSELFNYDCEGKQFLRTGDVWEEGASKKEPAFYDGEIDDKFIKKEDDYLFAFEGYNTKIGKGTIGLLTDSLEGIVSSHLYKVLNDENSKYYSLSLLKLDYIQNLILRQAVGTTVLSSTKSWKTLEYIFPKYKEEVNLINTVLSGNYKEIRELKKLLKSEKIRFEQMSEMLLSGEYILED